MRNLIMYSGLYLLMFSTVSLFISCDNDDSDDTATGTPVEMKVLSTVVTVSTEGDFSYTETSTLQYDTTGKLIKVMNVSGSYETYDIISYTGDNITKIESYEDDDDTPDETVTFMYTDGKLTSATEKDSDEDITYTYTYKDGKLSAFSKTYNLGEADDEELTGVSNIVWTGNNITNLDAEMGNETTNATATYDSYPQALPATSPDDFLTLFCENNVLKAFVTGNESEVFVNNTYTYEDDLVKTITSTDERESREMTLTYKTITVIK